MNVELVLVIVQFVVFAVAFVLTGKAIFHVFKIVTNITGRWADFMGPLILFSPSQLNAEGNKHRLAFGRLFLPLVVSYIVLFGIGVYLKHGL